MCLDPICMNFHWWYIPTCGKWTRMTRVSIGPILFCSIMFVGGFLHVTVGDLEIQFLICSFPCLFLLLQILLSFLVNLFWNFLDIDEIWMSLAYANDELSVLYYFCSKLFQKENKIVFFNFVSFFFWSNMGWCLMSPEICILCSRGHVMKTSREQWTLLFNILLSLFMWVFNVILFLVRPSGSFSSISIW